MSILPAELNVSDSSPTHFWLFFIADAINGVKHIKSIILATNNFYSEPPYHGNVNNKRVSTKDFGQLDSLEKFKIITFK